MPIISDEALYAVYVNNGESRSRSASETEQ